MRRKAEENAGIRVYDNVHVHETFESRALSTYRTRAVETVGDRMNENDRSMANDIAM